jgi:hypothetical protein
MATYRCRLIDCRGTPVDAVITTTSLEEASDFLRTAGALLPGWGYELWEDESLMISTRPQPSRQVTREKFEDPLKVLLQESPSKYVH